MENKSENVQENQISEKDMKIMSEEREAAEKDFKFVIIGGNEPLVNESFMNSVKESNIPVAIFELTSEEMKFIINSRAQKKAEEMSVDYLEDEKNKQLANEWVRTLIQRHLMPNRRHWNPKTEKMIEDAYNGDFEVIFTKTELKRASGLSWSEFNELFKTLELFGLVKYTINPKEFSLIIKQEEVVENKVLEVRQFVKLTLGKITALQKEKSLDSERVKKLKSIQRTFTNALEKL